MNQTYPSWLFQVKNGATTIWERWDGWTPEHGFQNPAMNSFNHYSPGLRGPMAVLGAGGISWTSRIPAINSSSSGPSSPRTLSYFKATLDSPYGLISSYWHIGRDKLLYDVTIPPNTSAMLTFPVPSQNVLQSGQPLKEKETDVTNLTLPAGTYNFSFPQKYFK